MPALALADPPAKELRSMDDRIAALAATEFTGTTDDDRRLALSMKALVTQVDTAAAVWAGPQPDRAVLRTVDARVTAAEVLLSVPCPPVFSPPVCTIYRRSFAEQAEPLAAAATETAVALGDDLPRKERKRRDDLRTRAAAAVAEVAERLTTR
jgi:hypothetical protein